MDIYEMDELFEEEAVRITSLVDDERVDDLEAFLKEPFKISYHFNPNKRELGLIYSVEYEKAREAFELGKTYKYVIVYLDLITEDEESGTSYSFDLVTPRGLYVYQSYLNEDGTGTNYNFDNRIATYIHFRNLKTKLDVKEKQYYLLSLNSLNRDRLTNEDSALYISVYDFGDLQGGDSVIPELRPINGLMALVYKGKSLPNPIIPSFLKGKMKLQVNNVGRGNWNEIIVGNKPCIVYDMGTNIEKKSWNGVKSLAEKHKYERKPTLIISHWDLDHYNVFLYMNNTDREHFSQMIVTSTLPSLTPFRLLQEVVKHTKVKVVLVDNVFVKSLPILNLIDVNNSQLKLFVCPMTMNGSKFNTNESGLILDVDDENKNILLTGDCTYEQASEAIKQSYSKINQNKDHYLVVPHHGGGHRPKYITPQLCILKGAIISVDELIKDKTDRVGRHRYGHPTIEVVHHLIKDHHCKLYRTDYMNEDITI